MATNATTNQNTRRQGTTQSRSTQSRTKTSSTGPRSDAAKVREGLTKARNGAASYVRESTERAVNLQVGAALVAADRVNELVEPWTAQTTRESEVKGIQTRVRRELNKFERRGGTARRKATTRARQTRNRVERELNRRRRSVTTTVRQNRRKAETTLRQNRKRAERGLKKAQ